MPSAKKGDDGRERNDRDECDRAIFGGEKIRGERAFHEVRPQLR